MRAFTVFLKVIGNECFITNNQTYIESYKAFLKKVIDATAKKESKYKTLLKVIVEEAILLSYHDYFSELSGEESMLKKHIFEYFQSESRAQVLMNPMVLKEIVELIVDKIEAQDPNEDLALLNSQLVDM